MLNTNFKQTDNLNKTTVQDQKLNKKSKLNQKPKLTADQKATNRIKREQKNYNINQLYIIFLFYFFLKCYNTNRRPRTIIASKRPVII